MSHYAKQEKFTWTPVKPPKVAPEFKQIEAVRVMGPGETKEFIKRFYFTSGNNARYSLLLLGPPGCGKSTATVEASQEIASLLGKEFVKYDESRIREILAAPDRYFIFVDFRLTEVSELSDLIGIPREDSGYVVYKPLGWIKALSRCSGVLFLDEITNVQRLDVISASYKLLLDKTAGFTKFSEDVLIIAAGNTPEQSSVANMLPAPLVNRCLVIEVVRPTVESWHDWMNAHYSVWDKRTLAYLMRFQGDLLRVPTNVETLENYPTPRTWTQVAVRLTEKHLEPFRRQVVTGLLGKEVGEKFLALADAKLPTFDELCENPSKFRLLSIDEKYMASVEIGEQIMKSAKNIEKATNLLKLIAQENRELIVFIAATAGAKYDAAVFNALCKIPEVLTAFKLAGKLKFELQTGY